MRLMILFFLVFFTALAKAETTLVAVASNFTKPMTEIAAEFEKATGHSAKLSFGSSGKFVSQFENGAPFDVFLSADDKSTAKLQQGGFTVEKTDFTYALGKLVLWSATANYVDEKGGILNKGGFQHLSLADPTLAPYGAAAVDVLKSQNVLEKLQPLFVLGENISQAYQFISTGNAELGFVALSQVSENGKISSGSAWIVPQNLYAPMKQNAVLLKTGENNPAAKALLDYLKTAPAKAIIQKYGYDLPN
jgi:molybdate transport system substrate-binding protein